MDSLATSKPWAPLAPRTFDEALRVADILAKSDLVPRDYRGKPGNVLVAWQMGAEIGLSLMQSLQNISVINGRPSVWGDALLAIVQAHPEFEDIEETDNGSVATCTIRRRGRSPIARSFSMDDARNAGLTKKEGTWQSYPKRMRQMRARAFALRDAFADALRGISVAEEQGDVVDARPESPTAGRSLPTPPARQVVEAPASAEPPQPRLVLDEDPPALDDELDPEDYAVPFGKNTGMTLRELDDTALRWYATKYKGDHQQIRLYAQKALDQRINKRVGNIAERLENDSVENAAWGMTSEAKQQAEIDAAEGL